MGIHQTTLKKLYVELGQLDAKRRAVLKSITAQPEYIEEYLRFVAGEMKKKYYKQVKTGHIAIMDSIKVSPVQKKRPDASVECIFKLYDAQNTEYKETISFHVTVGVKKEIEKQIINNHFEEIPEKDYIKQKNQLDKLSLSETKKAKIKLELSILEQKKKKLEKELAEA